MNRIHAYALIAPLYIVIAVGQVLDLAAGNPFQWGGLAWTGMCTLLLCAAADNS